MAKLISICPKCGTKNEVVNLLYMRLDGYTTVECKKCGIRFRALLNEQDINNLFTEDSTFPVINTEKDYRLESEFYSK